MAEATTPRAIRDLTGPIPPSNWILPGQLLATAYPAKKGDPDTIQRWMDQLMAAGITTFVSLMEPKDREGLLPYEPYLVDRELEVRTPGYVHQVHSPRYDRSLIFINYPIVDRNVVADDTIRAMADQVIGALQDGQKVLVHCYGGKGRTGTLCSLVLARLYNLSGEEAIQRVYHSFSFRQLRGKYPLKLSRVQVSQVRRIGST